jgi:hypothetical protein
MANDTILSLIDAEIARLTQVRSLLANVGKADLKISERKNKKTAAVAAVKVKGVKAVKAVKAKAKKTRVLSPEARKRIADAQRKRWAAQKAKA